MLDGVSGVKADWTVSTSPNVIKKPDTTGLSEKDVNDTNKLLDGGVDSQKNIMNVNSSANKTNSFSKELPKGIFDKFKEKTGEKDISSPTTGILKPSLLPEKKEVAIDTDSLIARMQKSNSSTGTRLVIGAELDGASTKELKKALGSLEDKIVAGGPGAKEARTLVDLIEKKLSERKKEEQPVESTSAPAPSSPRKPLDVGGMVSRVSKENWGASSSSTVKDQVRSEIGDSPSWQLRDSLQSLKDQLSNGYAKHNIGAIRDVMSMMEQELNARKIGGGRNGS